MPVENSQARLASKETIQDRINKNEKWLWEWATIEFVRQWISCDNRWRLMAKKSLFTEDQFSRFRKAYSIARSTVETTEFQKTCKALQSLGEWKKLSTKFNPESYVTCWDWLADRLGAPKTYNKGEADERAVETNAWSAATKYMWFHFPKEVPLYDANAKRSLAALRGVKLSTYDVSCKTTAQNYFQDYGDAFEKIAKPKIKAAQSTLGMTVPYELRVFDKYLWFLSLNEKAFDMERKMYQEEKPMFKAVDTRKLFAKN